MARGQRWDPVPTQQLRFRREAAELSHSCWKLSVRWELLEQPKGGGEVRIWGGRKEHLSCGCELGRATAPESRASGC